MGGRLNLDSQYWRARTTCAIADTIQLPDTNYKRRPQAIAATSDDRAREAAEKEAVSAKANPWRRRPK
jgi:hypothetical protein